MPHGVDHVADAAKGGVELARLGQQYTIPDFVKRAKYDETLEPPPVTAYADPIRRQFPCHTNASTFLSYMCYREKEAEFHPKDRDLIKKRLGNYIGVWNIKAAIDTFEAQWAAKHKTAEDVLPDSAYAYVRVTDSGAKDRRLPLRSAMEVKAAAEWLEQYRDRISFKDRHTIAKRILEKAASFGAALGEQKQFLEKQAGAGLCDPKAVVRMISNRATLCDNVQVRAGIFKIAETVESTPNIALQPNMLVKLAETIDQFDRANNLVGRYSEGLPRPEDVIFGTTFSKAAEDVASLVATTSGAVYEKSALAKLPVDDLRALFGDEFVARVQTPMGRIDVEKMAEEIATLPRPDAVMLEDLLGENGVAPAMRKAASARQGLSPEQLKEWAEVLQSSVPAAA